MRQAIAVAAFNFLLVPIPVTISALLRRGMAFEAVTVSSVAGAFAAATMSVLLAFLHFGFMSPIWGALTGSVATTLVCLAYRPDMRIFRPTLADWRGVVGFGGYSSATALINVLHQSSPQLILGRVLDLAAAGLYSRAVTVSQLFDKLVLDVLRPVIMPALSERARAGADLRKIYLQALEHITVLHWPPLIFLALTADPVVDLLFGSQWTAIVPFVRIVAVASLALSPACLTYPVLVSLGGVRDTFTASLISVPLSLLVMFVASFFGILAVAASTFVTAPLQVFVALAFIRRYLAFGVGDLLRAVRKSAAVTVCATAGALPVIAAGRFDLDDMSIAGMSGVAFATAAGWSLGLWVTKHPLLAELQDIALAVRRRGWLRRPDLPAIRRRTEAAHTKG